MMNKVVASLRKEYSRLEREMGQVGKALAEAQKLRWAKVRKAAAKLMKS